MGDSTLNYCFSWNTFFTLLSTHNARKAAHKLCSYCGSMLEPHNSLLMQLKSTTHQCTACKGYSCCAWRPSSTFPHIEECDQCLALCFSCRPVSPACGYCRKKRCCECEQMQLVCQYCDAKNSCSDCGMIAKCKQCADTSCRGCRDDIKTCDRCKETHCEQCVMTDSCDKCGEYVCNSCGDLACCEKVLLLLMKRLHEGREQKYLHVWL